MSADPLPRGMSIVRSASHVPCCDLCGWIGKDAWTDGDARSAAKAHARGAEHRENEANASPRSPDA